MMVVTILAILLLCAAIVLCGGTLIVSLKAACAQPSRVEQIRRLRQEGLAVNQGGEEA